MACIYCRVYTTIKELTMPYARVFQSGNSQAVRLPKEFRFQADRVEIYRRGDELVMREEPLNAAAIFDALASLPTDFMTEGREDTPPQERDRL
jgi:antitoxin VapB